MNASHFLDVIAKKEFSAQAELAALCEKYPYFASAQLARLKSKAELEASDLAMAALFKQDSWLFAQWCQAKSSSLNQSEKITHSETEEYIKNEHENGIQDEPQEDILTLINELPNSNPISEAKLEQKAEETHNATDSENSTSGSEPMNNQEDPEKSLMVMMSFTDWLNYFKTKKQKEEEEEKDKKALKTHWQKEKLAAAVEEDVDEIPEPIFKQAMDSISSESGIISESLAKILADQGKIDKAIDMYKKLSLRNPEKRSYFADLIENLNTKRD